MIAFRFTMRRRSNGGGVGKSELAREFARRHRETYPGGRFIVDAGKQAIVVDLARIGQALLGLTPPPGMLLEDQALQTMAALGALPTLLILDNAQDEHAMLPWLPAAGMPCHVLMTTTLDRWDAGWLTLEVQPLSAAASLDLIEKISSRAVADRYGAKLADLAGGPPGSDRAGGGNPGV